MSDTAMYLLLKLWDYRGAFFAAAIWAGMILWLLYAVAELPAVINNNAIALQ